MAPATPPPSLTADRRPFSFVRAFLASAFGTGVSRVLGAVRDVVIANFLGASAQTDAFWMAFTIPSAFRRFVADEGLTGALVPAVAQAEAEDGEAAARRLANAAFTAMMGISALISVAGMVWAPAFVTLFASGWRDDPELFALTVTLTRWMMPFLVMVSAVSFMEGLLNHRHHFFVPKVAPGIVNGGIVAGVLVAGGWFDPPVFAIAAGLLVGGAVHVLVNVPPLIRMWGALWPSLAFRQPRFRRLFTELGKVTVIGLFAQVNIVVLRQLASLLEEGSVSHYMNANRLVDLAQGVIAVAIGSALLPSVSQAVANQEWGRFRDELVRAFRLLAFLLFPSAAVLVGFAVPVTAVMYRHGAFTWADAQTTALALAWFTPYMLAVAGINVIKKAYFALDDRTTLLWIGAVGVAMTYGLGLALTSTWGVAGLSAALSASTVAQLGLYVVFLRRRVGAHLGLSRLVGPLARMALASVPVAGWLALASAQGDWSRGPTDGANVGILVLGLGGAVALYVGLARALGIEELTAVSKRLRARFGRRS